MARIAGSSGPKTLKAIHESAIDLIYQFGYEAVSLRQLAGEVGIQAGSLYNHIASKEDLLFQLVLSNATQLNAAMDEALVGLDDPDTALRAFIQFHIHYYTLHKKQVAIGTFELRSLHSDHSRQVAALRTDYNNKLMTILLQGVAQGLWAKANMQITACAIIAMLTDICVWYEPDGPYSVDALIDHYTDLVLFGIRPTPVEAEI